MPDGDATLWPGHDATSPRRIPRDGWKQIGKRIWKEVGDDHVPLLAAGLAFYGLLAIFPTLIAAVTIYGLLADPATVREQIQSVFGSVSGGTAQVVNEQLTSIVTSSSRALTWGLVLSLLAALWTASTGVLNLIKSINIVYDEQETRNFFKQRALAFVFALGAIVFFLLAVTLVAVLPSVMGLVGLEGTTRVLIDILRWPVLVLLLMAALGVVYRMGPDRRSPRARWVSWGSAVAIVIWLLASWGFSYYVQNFGSYNETYGSLGGVIILLMWFYLTGFSILLGAEINSEIELQTGVDSTVGEPRPRGERGAVKADEIP
ncbi:MAG: YihY/virulence factor BrkB family protein [Candidatus Krumholzibacteriia bacterium]